MSVSKIDPKVIFASEAPSQDTPAVFTNPTVGWGETRKNGGRPTIKQMNALQQQNDLKILWLNENAVTPFDSTIDYPINAVTIKEGSFKIFDGTNWNIFIDKTTLGLSNVDNTSDLNKPISTATQQALDNKTHNSLQQRDVTNAHPTSSILDASGSSQQSINDLVGNYWYSKVGGYVKNSRVLLTNGNTVYSTVDGNTNNPNSNMSGWSYEVALSSSSNITPTPSLDNIPLLDSNIPFGGIDGMLNSQAKALGNRIEFIRSRLNFNTVNVLDYIPSSQHDFIKSGNVDSQDKTAVTNGISSAISAANSLTLPRLVFPSGIYATNDTIVLDLPNGSDIVFNGTIATSALYKPSIVIGSYVSNRAYYSFSNVSTYHLDMNANITGDTSLAGAGVLILNLFSSVGNIKRANGFASGVLADSTLGNGGTSYNIITLGYIKDNIYPIQLKMSLPSGYTNENTFIGGALGHSSAFPYTGNEIDIKVGQGISTQTINNNLFFRPSLESNAATTQAALLEGNSNSIYMPRVENSQNYTGFSITFGTTSVNCSVFGLGFGLKNTNIINNGAQNKYQTISSMFLDGDASGTNAVLELRNSASAANKVLRATNPSKTETFSVLASGQLTSSSTGYFQNGVRWSTSDGTTTDKGIFVSTGSPDGATTARVGSLCVDMSSSIVYTKKSGTGNTGWIRLQEVTSGTTANRPATNLSTGVYYFDTTLNKPIWRNTANTGWVDATGATV